MSDHPPAERLDDYVDGLLDAGVADGIERHLRRCDSCRAFVDRSRSLMEDLRSLPREITPPRDLRPDPPIAVPDSSRDLTGTRAWRPRLAAAAVILAVVGSAVLLVVQGPGGGQRGEVPVVTGAGESAGGEVSSRLRDYRRASRQLADAYQRRRERLSPAAVGPVDASLASLDRAIERTTEALARNRDGPLLRRMLATRYERKIELLRRALNL